MGKEQYLKILNEAFGNFKFFPKDHHYEYNGQPVGISVTRFIEEFCNEFDAELIASRVAAKKGLSVQDVLEEWEAKNDWACEKGSICHEYIQGLWKNEPKIHVRETLTKKQEEDLGKLFVNSSKFYEDFKDKLEHLADEFVIGSMEYDIASAIDHLFINKSTGELILVDYKTNTDIHKNERYAKKMKTPLEHLRDCSLDHYAIQVSIYKYLIEKYTDLKVSEWFIVWMSENNKNYEIISVPYLKKEVEEILERREWGL